MATVGVSFGALLAAPFCVLDSRNMTPTRWLYYPARGVQNILRGIEYGKPLLYHSNPQPEPNSDYHYRPRQAMLKHCSERVADASHARCCRAF